MERWWTCEIALEAHKEEGRFKNNTRSKRIYAVVHRTYIYINRAHDDQVRRYVSVGSSSQHVSILLTARRACRRHFLSFFLLFPAIYYIFTGWQFVVAQTSPKTTQLFSSCCLSSTNRRSLCKWRTMTFGLQQPCCYIAYHPLCMVSPESFDMKSRR